MKTRIAASVLLTLVFAASAQAQVSVQQHVWTRGIMFFVWNDTEDEKSIKLNFDGEDEGAIAHGEKWVGHIGGHLFIVDEPYSHKEYLITVQACKQVLPATVTAEPPDWATNRSLLEDLALDDSFLEKVNESNLKKRVGEIKSLLDKNKTLGRKNMKNNIDQWFKEVKRNGFSYKTTKCVGPITEGARTTVNSDWFYNAKEIRAIYVRGSREKGYRLDVPEYFR